MTTQVNDIIALANVGANLGEIVGLATGFTLIFASWIPALNQYEGACKSMLKQGGLLLMAAYLSPRVVEIPEKWNDNGAAIFSWLIFLLLASMSFRALCMPTSIALKNKKSNKTLIITLNVFLLIPFSWFVALFLATRKDKSIAPQE